MLLYEYINDCKPIQVFNQIHPHMDECFRYCQSFRTLIFLYHHPYNEMGSHGIMMKVCYTQSYTQSYITFNRKWKIAHDSVASQCGYLKIYACNE